MITGEKKLRENLGELYGGVNGYSGRPTQSQIESAAVLKKQLDDANAKFQSLTAQVAQLNSQLQNSKVAPLTVDFPGGVEQEIVNCLSPAECAIIGRLRQGSFAFKTYASSYSEHSCVLHSRGVVSRCFSQLQF